MRLGPLDSKHVAEDPGLAAAARLINNSLPLPGVSDGDCRERLQHGQVSGAEAVSVEIEVFALEMQIERIDHKARLNSEAQNGRGSLGVGLPGLVVPPGVHDCPA